jgi:hypothetical protein
MDVSEHRSQLRLPEFIHHAASSRSGALPNSLEADPLLYLDLESDQPVRLASRLFGLAHTVTVTTIPSLPNVGELKRITWQHGQKPCWCKHRRARCGM